MSKKRIFTSFAMKDRELKDLFVGQSKNENCPIEMIDMSVKEPWDSQWKTNCRIKIKGCDGLIAIISENTRKAEGQLWEMKCALEEGIPCIGIFKEADKNLMVWYLPTEFKNIKLYEWNWAQISNWINNIPPKRVDRWSF